jgi:hypothetical protein
MVMADEKVVGIRRSAHGKGPMSLCLSQRAYRQGCTHADAGGG